MSFGHRCFSQLHNLRKCRKDGAPLGGIQGTHRGALRGWGPHPIMSQVKEVPLQLGNWKGKVDLLVSTVMHPLTP